MQLQLVAVIQAPPNLTASQLECLVVPCLRFHELFEIEGQLHDALLFGDGGVLGHDALLVVLKTHAVELLSQLAVLDAVFVFSTVVIWGQLFAIPSFHALTGQLRAGFGAGLRVLLQ